MSRQRTPTEEEKRRGPRPRRAGLRSDELDVDEVNESGDDDITAAGTPGGGAASGGMGGTNAGDGSIEDVDDLDNALGAGPLDNNGDTLADDEPQSGRSGGAVGGTPAFKRSRGD